MGLSRDRELTLPSMWCCTWNAVSSLKLPILKEISLNRRQLEKDHHFGVAGALAVWGEAEGAEVFQCEKGNCFRGTCQYPPMSVGQHLFSIKVVESSSSQWCLVRGWLVIDMNWNKSFRLDIKKTVWDDSLTGVLVDNIHCYPCICQAGHFIAEVSNWLSMASC